MSTVNSLLASWPLFTLLSFTLWSIHGILRNPNWKLDYREIKLDKICFLGANTLTASFILTLISISPSNSAGDLFKPLTILLWFAFALACLNSLKWPVYARIAVTLFLLITPLLILISVDRRPQLADDYKSYQLLAANSSSPNEPTSQKVALFRFVSHPSLSCPNDSAACPSLKNENRAAPKFWAFYFAGCVFLYSSLHSVQVYWSHSGGEGGVQA